MHYQRILLSMNCSGDEKSVVDEVMQLKSFFKSKLAITAVNDPGAGKAHMLMDTLPKVTKADILNRLQAYGYGEEAKDVEIIIEKSESYAQTIARSTREFDLLVMGHHRKNRLLAFIKDSVDEQVADRIDCPVLLVPLKNT